VVAPAPERPIDGGMATEALVAHVLVSKFCDSLPLYRQSKMLARQGVEFDRSTLSNWVGRACWWLMRLYELLLGTALSAPKLFADDTTLPVLDPGRGRTKTGRLWCYAVDDRPGPALVIRLPPMFMLRIAKASVISELYAIEAEIRGYPAGHRRQIRQERSRPIVEVLHVWLQNHVGRISAVSDLGKAIGYALRHWPGLVVFLDGGRIEIDANTVERAIRPNTLNRKNVLFAGSDVGALSCSSGYVSIKQGNLGGDCQIAGALAAVPRHRDV
jgi:Transposase IS66 family